MSRQTDYEKHFREAVKYSTRTEFSKMSKMSYQMLWRHGLLDDACAHMVVSPVYSAVRWSHDAVFAEAAKYRNRAEFKRECSGAHGYALAHGILAQACAYMRGQRFWHVFELMAVAIKYKSRHEFIASEKSAYNFCNKNGLTDLICAHMSRPRTWTKEAVLASASECQSRGAFQALYSGAYKHADAGGYLDEACAHMPAPEYGFAKHKPATLYFLLVTCPGGLVLHKVGITNRDPLERIAGMGLHPGVTVEVVETITFHEGRDARITEKRLHRKFSSNKYGGPPVMKNGNTELFTVNVLDT